MNPRHILLTTTGLASFAVWGKSPTIWYHPGYLKDVRMLKSRGISTGNWRLAEANSRPQMMSKTAVSKNK